MVNISDIQDFFFDRLIETFKKDTIDSHRVRCHNVLTLLKESHEVITDWTNLNVKLFETVKFCLQETRDAIVADTCLRYINCNKTILIKEIDDYCKTGEKGSVSANRLLFLISMLIEENRNTYLEDLMNKLIDIYNRDTWDDDTNEMAVFESMDSLILAFATQLIHEGFSKIYLYKLFHRLKEDHTQNAAKKINHIKRLLCVQGALHTTTIMKISINKDNRWISDMLGLVDNVPESLYNEDMLSKHKSFLSPSQYQQYFIFHSEKAKDSISALKEAREQLAQIMDAIHMGDSSINITLPNKALVLTTNPDASIHFEMATEYVLDGGYHLPETDIKGIVQKIEQIYADATISDDIKERLMSALRHLRIGDSQNELEQKFINYWIALEFIFASPDAKESTFPRLKDNLTCLLSACYTKRNLLNLESKLRKQNIIQGEDHIWNLSADKYNELLERSNSGLTRYRIRKAHSLFEHSDKIKKYITTHEENLIRHISRLYRLRNELIHEAAIKQDIESVSSNLRYYLVFLINQLVLFCTAPNNHKASDLLTLSDFFFTYDLHQKKIKQSHSIDDIMSVPCDSSIFN